MTGNADHKHLCSEFGENIGDGYVETGHFKSLGAPVGDRESIEAFVKERVEKIRAILQKAGELDNAHCMFYEPAWVTVRLIMPYA